MAQTFLLNEGFEGAFPSKVWTVGDSNFLGGLAYWGSVDSEFGGQDPHSGSRKGYCAGVGYEGTTAAPRYPSSVESFLRTTFSLAAYSGANLTFWYKIPSLQADED